MKTDTSLTTFAQSHAIIIGINDYQELSPLQTAVNDAQRLAEILAEQHQYQCTVLVDATYQQIVDLLAQLPKQIGTRDRVLFYFAGHGIAADSEEGLPKGYLLPKDARRNTHDQSIEMEVLHQTFEQLSCRHFLLILDCCFSGAFKWSSGFRGLQLVPKRIYKERYDQYVKDPAWQVITSSAYNEEALDIVRSKAVGAHGVAMAEGQAHSPFALALFQGLQGAADLVPKDKGDGIITASELYLHLREAITPMSIDLGAGSNRHRQTPSLFPLKKHDRGEFIFLTADFNYQTLPSFGDMQINPYKGLQSYTYGKQVAAQNKQRIVYEDKDFFYGRDRVIATLLERITTNNFLVVTGASGTGKSSVVKAGLLPKLEEQGYTILPIIRPGNQPLAVWEQLQLSKDAQELQHKVLLIDQYEELITQCHQESERLQFIKKIKAVLESNIPNFKIILTLRSDFEPQFDRLVLGDYWPNARYVVPAFNPEELREVIVQPATQRVLHFEPPTLVHTIVDEVQQAPGALPLLSFTLSELYQLYLKNGLPKKERALTLLDYQSLGGVKGALRTSANAIYDNLDAEHQITMQKVMLRMVSQEGGELASRRVYLEELTYSHPAENERVQRIIQQLVQARLIVQSKEEESGKRYIEPAHDALVRGWGKLLRWVSKVGEYRLGLLYSLHRDVLEYESNKQNTAYLWDENPRLEEVNLEREQAIGLLASNAAINQQRAGLLKKQLQVLVQTKQKAAHPITLLNAQEDAFVQQSKQKKSKELRQLFLIVLAAFIALAGLAAYAYYNQGLANTNAAKAEQQATIASTKQCEAEDAAMDAIYAAALAEQERRRANQQTEIASTERDNAERQQGIAERQTEKALREQQKAEQQLRTTYANQLAEQASTALENGDRTTAFQLATFAHRFIDTTGNPNAARVIHNAYYYNDNPKHQSNNLQKAWNRSFEGHLDNISAVAFSPDGRYALTGSWDKTAKLWKVESAQEIRSFVGHSAYVSAVAFSPDGRYVLTGSGDDTAKLWELESAQEIQSFEGHSINNVTTVAFSPDGRYILMGDLGITAKLWEADTGKEIFGFEGHYSSVMAVAFSPNGRYALTGSGDGTSKIWEVDTGKEIHSLEGHSSSVLAVAFSSNGRYILTGSKDSTAKLWEVDTGKEIRSFEGHSSSVLTVAFSPNGRYTLTGSEDGTAKLWEIELSKEIYSLEGHSASISDVAFSSDGHYVLTGSWDNTAKLWEVKPIQSFEEHSGSVYAVTFSPNGRYALTGSFDGTAKLWEIESAKKIHDFQGHSANIFAVAFSSSGRYILTGSRDNTARLWEVESAQEIHSFLGHSSLVEAVAFSPDDRYALTGSRDNTAKLWEVESAKEIHNFQGHTNKVEAVAFSPDGRYVLTGSRDNTAKLWEVESAKEIRSFLGHSAELSEVAFSPDGRYALTGSRDNTAKLWEVESAKEIRNFQGHWSEVYAVAFSPDGRYVLTGSLDKTAKLWEVDMNQIITSQYQQCLLTSLSADQLEQYDISSLFENLPDNSWNLLLQTTNHYLLRSMGDYLVAQVASNNNPDIYNTRYQEAEQCYQRAIQLSDWAVEHRRLATLYAKWKVNLLQGGYQEEAMEKQRLSEDRFKLAKTKEEAQAAIFFKK